jgi:uncharacterized membrane protein YphA (DoxX/SURF4 family)
MTTAIESNILAPAGTPIKVALWIAQILVAAVFIMAGLTKFMTPIPELAKMMPWTGELPLAFVRSIGLIDVAGGIGILLPALTRIKPNLTVLAALCCVVLQIFAIVFHASRGEFKVLPLNFVLLPLAAFVWWGRSKKAPILPR